MGADLMDACKGASMADLCVCVGGGTFRPGFPDSLETSLVISSLAGKFTVSVLNRLK